MAKRRNFTAAFKAKVALEALGGDRTLAELAGRHKAPPNLIAKWKRQASAGMVDVFSGKKGARDECVYLQAFETGSQARTGIGGWIDDYNTKRPHSGFDGRTPEEVYAGRDALSPGHAPEMAPGALAA